MRRVFQLAAGLADSGFAALGTFLAGVLAVRELDVGLLAVYAVLAASTVFAMPLSRQLVYLPSQVASNLRTDVVMPVLRHEVRRALPLHAAGVAIVLVVAATLLPGHDVRGVIAVAGTGALFVVVSPLQDHVRSCLHLIGWHRRAASCSVVLAVVVAVVVAAVTLGHLPTGAVALVPFGALTLANLTSAAYGTVLLRGAARDTISVRARFSARAQFLASELGIQGAWLACTYLVLLLAGSAATASLEAARITAAPVFILSSAVSTFVAPALLRRLSPDAPDRRGAIREIGVALGLLLGGAVAWLLVLSVAGDWVSVILNKPFDLGLVSLRAVASSLEGAAALMSIALLAMKLARTAFVTSLLAAGIGLVGTAALALPLGAAALPISQGTGMLVQLLMVARRGSRAVDTLVRDAPPARELQHA